MLGSFQNKKDKKFLFFIVLVSAAYNFSFLEYNNYLIRKINPDNTSINGKSLVFGQTVFSVDNEYYLSPVDNFLSGKGWKRSPAVSNGDYFRRVPGYSTVYLIFIKIFGHSRGHFFLKIFQLFLFLSTIPAIFYLAGSVSGKSGSRFITLIYAFVPFISSWTYYTLTESISPALVVFYLYFLLKAYHTGTESIKLKNYIAASLFFVCGVLTRPYIAMAGLPLLIFSFKDFIGKRPDSSFRNFAIIWLIPFLFVGSWTLRNYLLTKEFVPLEKSIHPQTLDRMKPEFRGLWRFAKCWGEDGLVLNSYHDPLYFAALHGDTSSAYVNQFLSHLPLNIVKEFGQERLYTLIKRYQLNVFKFKPYSDSVKAMPEQYLPEELYIEKEFDGLVSEYRREHFFNYWIMTPAIYLKRMIVHSNTGHLYFFQVENREKKYVNLYRYLLLMIHIFIYAALVLNLFVMRGWVNRFVFVFIPFLFIIFFTVFHREIEQRYMLPILPILITGSACGVEKVFQFATNFIKVKLAPTDK